MQDVKIRQMTFEDVDAVLTIEQSVKRHPWSKTMFEGCFTAKYSNWVLLKNNDFIVGYAIFLIIDDEVELLNIAIKKENQHQGLGCYFLDTLLRQFETANIYLEVRESNLGAIQLYKKLNFQQIDIRKNYYKADDCCENAVIMRLKKIRTGV